MSDFTEQVGISTWEYEECPNRDEYRYEEGEWLLDYCQRNEFRIGNGLKKERERFKNKIVQMY